MDNLRNSGIYYSIVIPIYNEEENIPLLYSGLKKTIETIGKPAEIIFIDDGSYDGSLSVLKKETKEDPNTKIVPLQGHPGKSAALQAGFDLSQGRYVITMDGDRQFDPDDIKLLLSKMEKGAFGAVCGWRKQRKDPVMKVFFSRLANYLRRLVFGESIHDVGCPFRIYSREALRNIRLTGEQHRFITAIMKKNGVSIGEVEICHIPRSAGKSKYGFWNRLISSIPDFFKLIFAKQIK